MNIEENAIHCSDLEEDGLMEVEYFFTLMQPYQSIWFYNKCHKKTAFWNKAKLNKLLIDQVQKLQFVSKTGKSKLQSI